MTWPAGIALGFLAVFLVVVLAVAWRRTWGWNDQAGMGGRLRGLALPNGSVRSVLALAIVIGFLIFAFFGTDIVEGEQFNTVFAAWVTLTGAVSGFYFGARSGQSPPERPEKPAKGAPRFTVGEDDPPAAPAPDASVYLSRASMTAYLARGGMWETFGTNMIATPISLSSEQGVDLNGEPPALSAETAPGSYVVAEDPEQANYRLAYYTGDGATWKWHGASVAKPATD